MTQIKSAAITAALLMAAPIGIRPAAAADAATTITSAAEIVEKNVAARGGLDAWRGVKTLSLSGTLGAGGNQRASLDGNPTGQISAVARTPGAGGRGRVASELPARPVDEVRLPFVMELKRPQKMRFELKFAGNTAVQVFDGVQGWKLRPFFNRHDAEPYTPEEIRIASIQGDLDGPLVDYAAKGSKIELAGQEKIEDRDTYNIKVTMKNGSSVHVWIDAQTFLEVKMDGQPRRLDGVDHPVQVYFRDFKLVSGIQIPFVVETRVLPARSVPGRKDAPVPPERTILEKVLVNSPLDDALFTKPGTE